MATDNQIADHETGNEYVRISAAAFGPARKSLLAQAYEQVYAPVFPLENGGEPLARWVGFLENPDGVNDHRIIVAGTGLDSPSPVIKAITVSNYYPASDTGLLGYIAVDKAFRKEGLGMKLVDAQADFLEAAARTHGQTLRGWFLGCFNPARTGKCYDGYNGQRLVDKYLGHGLCTVPVDYRLPATIYEGGRPGDPKIGHYMLMAGRHPVTGALPDERTVMGFIASLYQELGIADPAADADFQDMARQLAAAKAAPAPRGSGSGQGGRPGDKPPAPG